ncbi:helix-turn-helix domain-containing protein [Streptomyces sp. C10-9-1]|uniref:helix-turn-helix domain-containing protein n=1 Tax=Streptomyces sp. C10-9-1 TaxID=1859285 RepID=UPI00211199BC|nr:helix-turn-helix transcriptional regulator [Streptomyces sp. C10-9-1]MCQ6552390.1 helix-turn-helix domain-containing protein [Streptomyces sp. C10-9-1]
MSARKPPTERRRRLGTELRRMRERAGLSVNEAAVLHGTDRTTVSNTESARSGVSPDRVRHWAANYACPEPRYVDGLVAMARERVGGQWWDDYRDVLPSSLLDIAELEHHAVAFRLALMMHMPGLLQHPDYTRAVYDMAVPALSEETRERLVEFRQARAAVLERHSKPRCTFLIHEAALRMRFGGRAVVLAQFRHLSEQAERPNVAIRVVPFAAGGFPNPGAAAFYAHGPVADLDTVQLDVPTGVTFLHAPGSLENYREVLDRMEQCALGPRESLDFIGTVAKAV